MQENFRYPYTPSRDPEAVKRRLAWQFSYNKRVAKEVYPIKPSLQQPALRPTLSANKI